MNDLLSIFQEVHKNVWGDSIFQWLFYFSVILIILIEKRTTVKIVFAFYPIIIQLLIFNPLTCKIIALYSKPSLTAYYSRMFEMVPIIFCIAQGMMIITNKTRSKWLKLMITCILSVTIVCIGADTNTFKQPWERPADNLQKVPKDLLQIYDIVKSENSPVCIATPSLLSFYIRQIDSSLYTPYGRYVNELGVALDEIEKPDVALIMSRAGAEDCDYIVAYNRDAVKNSFSEAGYYSMAETDNYLLYKVKDVPRIDRTFNDKRQIISRTNYDAEDRPIPFDNKSYCTICYEYDEYGNQSKEYYLDNEGRQIVLPEGYAAIERTYYPISGLVKTINYKDLQGNPTETIEGYSEIKKEYKNKKLTKELYYDKDGNFLRSENNFKKNDD